MYCTAFATMGIHNGKSWQIALVCTHAGNNKRLLASLSHVASLVCQDDCIIVIDDKVCTVSAPLYAKHTHLWIPLTVHGIFSDGI